VIHFEFLVVAVDCDSLVHYSDFVMLEFGSAGQVKIEESTQIYLMCYRLISLWFSWFARRQQYFAIFLPVGIIIETAILLVVTENRYAFGRFVIVQNRCCPALMVLVASDEPGAVCTQFPPKVGVNPSGDLCTGHCIQL
jgi:hypothetical protein